MTELNMVTTRISDEERENRAYLAGLVRAATRTLREDHSGYLKDPTKSAPRLLNHLLDCIEENAGENGIAAVRATDAAILAWSAALERPSTDTVPNRSTLITSAKDAIKQWGSELRGRTLEFTILVGGDRTIARLRFSHRRKIVRMQWLFPNERYAGEPARGITADDDPERAPWLLGSPPQAEAGEDSRRPFDNDTIAAKAEELLKVCRGFKPPPNATRYIHPRRANRDQYKVVVSWPRSRTRLPAIAVIVAVLLFPVCGGAVYAVARSKAIRLLGQSAIAASAGCDSGSGRGEARIAFSSPIAPPVLLFRDDQLVGELTLETRQHGQYKYGFLDRGLSPGTHVTYRVAKQLWLTGERLYTARVGTTVPPCRAGNHSPTSEGLAIRPARSVAGAPVVFEVLGASDPDGDALTVLWNFGDGVVRSGRTRDVHLFENPGQFVVTATLSDPGGGTVAVNASIEILPGPAGRAPTTPEAPLLDLGDVTPLEGKVGSTFLVTARPPREATERCHAPLAYRFTFENQLTRTSWDSVWVTSPTLPVRPDEKGAVAVSYAVRCGERSVGHYAIRSFVRVY